MGWVDGMGRRWGDGGEGEGDLRRCLGRPRPRPAPPAPTAAPAPPTTRGQPSCRGAGGWGRLSRGGARAPTPRGSPPAPAPGRPPRRRRAHWDGHLLPRPARRATAGRGPPSPPTTPGSADPGRRPPHPLRSRSPRCPGRALCATANRCLGQGWGRRAGGSEPGQVQSPGEGCEPAWWASHVRLRHRQSPAPRPGPSSGPESLARPSPGPLLTSGSL